VNEDFNTKQRDLGNDGRELFFALSDALEIGFEWLLVRENGTQNSFKRDELEISYKNGEIFLGYPSGEDVEQSKILTAEKKERGFLLTACLGEKTEKIELIPRITAAELVDATNAARLEMAHRIAKIAAAQIESARVVSVRLSKGIRICEFGPNAQIVLQISPHEQIAAFAQAVGKGANVEAFLASAISWFLNIQQRARKANVQKLWLVFNKRNITKLKKTLALLKPAWRERIELFELDPENEGLKKINVPEFRNLWREKPRKIKIPAKIKISETAGEVVSLAPGAIDITYSAHGENLRYHGLPFMRVRTLLGEEKAWFGADKKRRALDPENVGELDTMLSDLREKRNALAESRDHYFYRASPEHWLEALLRRDITQLDGNLILSPIYQQFRVSAEQVDLLALRKDGQLVVIELKVAPNREVIFQAANYWRLIELHRRSGNLKKARAFGDIEIADVPAMVYLAAPALSFHQELESWAAMLNPKIEIYRYSLHENWREEIKVIERRKL
jgi:hypothetical protein